MESGAESQSTSQLWEMIKHCANGKHSWPKLAHNEAEQLSRHVTTKRRRLCLTVRRGLGRWLCVWWEYKHWTWDPQFPPIRHGGPSTISAQCRRRRGIPGGYCLGRLLKSVRSEFKWETPSPNIKWKQTEEDPWHQPLTSTSTFGLTYIHRYMNNPAPTPSLTHTYAKKADKDSVSQWGGRRYHTNCRVSFQKNQGTDNPYSMQTAPKDTETAPWLILWG